MLEIGGSVHSILDTRAALLGTTAGNIIELGIAQERSCGFARGSEWEIASVGLGSKTQQWEICPGHRHKLDVVLPEPT